MNSFLFVLVLSVCATIAVCDHEEHEDHDGPAHYQFGYSVHDPHTGDIKEQQEVRDGHVVKGSYSLYEPDGTKRIVEYIADPHSGFNAVVKRIGHARHPQHYHNHKGAESDDEHYGGAESTVGVTHYGYHY